MKYQWLENKTCNELSEELGCEILSITRGELIIGMDEYGEEITRNGIEIEVKGKLNAEQLTKIDSMMPAFKRRVDITPILEEL